MLDISSISSLVELFDLQCERYSEETLIHFFEGGKWQTISWRKIARQSNSLASTLAGHGLGRGDRLLLVADNSKDWLIAELAVLRLGAILVPSYGNGAVEDWAHLLRDSGARMIIADKVLAKKIERLHQDYLSQVSLTLIIGAKEWLTAISSNQNLGLESTPPRSLDDTICLIYTSGTGGKPKGVELSNKNILNNCYGAAKNIESYGQNDHRFLSILPFAHAYAHSADIWTPIYTGAQIYISRDLKGLSVDLQYARPTIMNTVPRLWDVLHKQMVANLDAQSILVRYLFLLALRLGSKHIAMKSLTFIERLQNKICDLTVRKKVRLKMGGHLICALSAGSPLHPDITIFFRSLGVRIHQAYGQTECAPGITMNTANLLIPGTVGFPMHGMQVKLAEDGEVLVQGPSVMKGYWNDPEATKKVIINGWLHTGDIGCWDENGLLKIIERKKDFIKTSGSQMISPQSIEQQLAIHPDIEHVVIFGDGKPYLIAAVFPSHENIEALKNKTLSTEVLKNRIDEFIKMINKGLDSKCRVKKFVLIEDALSISNGTLTPSLKVKRDSVYKSYSHLIDSIFAA